MDLTLQRCHADGLRFLDVPIKSFNTEMGIFFLLKQTQKKLA
jgi:hypothetical protein